MADSEQTKSINVEILGRRYGLRVREEDEAFTRNVADFVDTRMKEFKETHPEQAELTTAVITALAIAEELHEEREEMENGQTALNEELDHLSRRLETVLDVESDGDG